VAGVVVLLASASSGAVVLAQAAHQPPALGLPARLAAWRDLGALLRTTLAGFGGKGGGSATFAQGSLPSKDNASEFVESMKTELLRPLNPGRVRN